MNALELANELDHTSDLGEFKHYEAAAMLRRQHEAIVKLRGALEHYVRLDRQAKTFFDAGCNATAEIVAEQALKDTEDLK